MKIVNFGQVVDLENGQGMVNQFTVLMPNGARVSVVCDAETLSQLVDLCGHLGEMPPTQDVYDDDYAPPDRDEEELSRYEDYDPTAPDPGEQYGEGDGLAREAEPVMGAMVEEPVHAPAAAVEHVEGLGSGTGHKLGEKKRRKPILDADGFMVSPVARTVQADEKGNPIVPGVASTPVEEPVEDLDEDGTQI